MTGLCEEQRDKLLLAKPCSQKGEANTLAGLVSGLYQAWQTCSSSLRSMRACFQWNESAPLDIHVCCGRVRQTRCRRLSRGFSSFSDGIRCTTQYVLGITQGSLKVLKLNLLFDQLTWHNETFWNSWHGFHSKCILQMYFLSSVSSSHFCCTPWCHWPHLYWGIFYLVPIQHLKLNFTFAIIKTSSAVIKLLYSD